MNRPIRTLLCIAALSAAGAAYVTQVPSCGANRASKTQGAIEPPRQSGMPTEPARQMICSGRIEAVRGEVEIAAQMPGLLAELRVSEGETVQEGQVLAVLEGARQTADLIVAQAAVAVARSRLQQLEAGTGQEEIGQALFETKAVEASLAYETTHLERMRTLFQRKAASRDELDQKTRRVEQLRRQRDSLHKRYQALQRGPLPEEIEAARAELSLAEARLERARVEEGYRFIRAPMAGTVVEVYRRAGDSVIVDQPTPILRLADTTHLQVRLEIDEANVPWLHPGMQGIFQVRGTPGDSGRLTLRTVVPVFGPKRLFNPDTSARLDTRTLTVLCEPGESRLPLYPGQRVTARFSLGSEF